MNSFSLKFGLFSSDNVTQNETNPSNHSTTYHYYGLPTVLAFSVLLIIIMIMSFVGNVLVITTILRNKDMRTRTNILLCNLAVADVLVALLDIPVAVYTLCNGDWPFSTEFCYFNGYLVGLGLMLSIHTLMWISIHKFISITRPLARTMTPGKIFCMIVAAWAWALLYNLGPLLGWTETVYKAGASQCGPVIPKTPLQISHSVTNTLFNFIIPICVMSYCYYKIFAEVREHMNRLQDFADTTMISSIVQQRRITKTLVIVFVCFILCWCPYIVYSTLLVIFGQDNVKRIFNPLAYLATYLNSACNPIIYALRSPSFLKGFKEILFGSKNVAHSSYGNSSFRWSRTNYGMMVSFRRSLLRTRSEPGGAVSGRRKDSQNGQIKTPIVPNRYFVREYRHRRTNTLPKRKRESEEQALPPISILNSSVAQNIRGPLEVISPAKASMTTVRTPVLSPKIILNEELTVEKEKEKLLLSPQKSFFETPTPKDKKYFIYFPKLEKSEFSISAPNLCLNLDSVESEKCSCFLKGDECLKVPEVLYTRASSEGNVKPWFSPHSCHSKSRLTESPKLTWQASLENINVELLSINCDRGKKIDSSRRNLNVSNSSQDSDRKSKLPTVINSVECLINNIFSSEQNKRTSNRKTEDTLEAKSNDLPY